MPSTTVYNMAGEAVEKLELSEQVFGVTPNVAVLHQIHRDHETMKDIGAAGGDSERFRGSQHDIRFSGSPPIDEDRRGGFWAASPSGAPRRQLVAA